MKHESAIFISGILNIKKWSVIRFLTVKVFQIKQQSHYNGKKCFFVITVGIFLWVNYIFCMWKKKNWNALLWFFENFINLSAVVKNTQMHMNTHMYLTLDINLSLKRWKNYNPIAVNSINLRLEKGLRRINIFYRQLFSEPYIIFLFFSTW